MTLTDPRAALADESNFIGYLVGIAGLAKVVHSLAADGDRHAEGAADDFVHLLVGLASLGDGIERLAKSAAVQPDTAGEARPSASETVRWLR